MFRESIKIGDHTLTFESGEIARQASGSVILSSGDTVLFSAATAERRPSRLSYMPLTTDFRLRFSAAGRIPGSYDRRESRPTEAETIASRLIDRSIRPFFPDGWCYDTQVIVQPLSFDPATDPAVLGIAAAAAALTASDIPWQGPVVGVRIARVGGTLKVFPAPDEIEASELDLTITVSSDGIVMVEGGGREVSEDLVLEAFAMARREAQVLLDLLARLAAEAPPTRPAGETAAIDPELERRVRELGEGPLREALAIADKLARYRAADAAKEDVLAKLMAADGAGAGDGQEAAGDLLEALKKEIIRGDILDGRRIGGRGPSDVREITGRTGWLSRCHGSSLFTRGETQAIVTCTLGTERDAKSHETLAGHKVDRFLLHYTFPPYSVGEVKPLRGPGRREIGHGLLARRALMPVLPSAKEAPYTIRLESLITESNGSSSMATVCGGTLAMQDAGLEMGRPVAGIAMGLVKEGERYAILSDILGDEDHVGDMDFKVCGTEAGITAIQLDNKLGAVPDNVMSEALMQARAGRLGILARMAEIQSAPRRELSPHAPRVKTIKIETNRIGGLVGAGGKTIKGLEADLGVSIDIAQDGTVRIFCKGEKSLRQAEARVRDLTGIAHLNEIYEGTVVSVRPFGSFVRLFEGIDGLIADEQLAMNARVRIKVTGVNNRGKLVLEKQ